MYRSILVPFDGSPFAEQALPLALAVAGRTGAALELLQVHVCYALKDPASTWGPYDPEADARLKEQERAYLDAVRQRLGAPGPVTCTVLDGMAGDALLERARAAKADLIVMTTHGRGPLGRAFLGSVADELVRRAPVPLLLVRPRVAGPAAEPAVRQVLAPLDGSALSEQVLGPALDLANALQASLLLFHVVAPAGGADPQAPLRGSQGRCQSPWRRTARAYLEGLAERLQGQTGEVRTGVLVRRHVASAILEEAEAGHCDLIALATHGRGGLHRLLLGSVADKVVRGASAPVFVYHPPAG